MEKNDDLNKSDLVMFIAFGLKLNELMTIIFIFAYYIGIGWMIMCEMYEDFVDDTNYATHQNVDELNENFLTTFKIHQ